MIEVHFADINDIDVSHSNDPDYRNVVLETDHNDEVARLTKFSEDAARYYEAQVKLLKIRQKGIRIRTKERTHVLVERIAKLVESRGVVVSKLERAERKVDELTDSLENLRHWRELALQFDNHRIAALWHLKALLADSRQPQAARDFLAAPPMSSHEVVAERDALKAEVSYLTGTLKQIASDNVDLQSELTKARELLTELVTCSPADVWAAMDKVRTFLARQPAPAEREYQVDSHMDDPKPMGD